MALPRDVQSSGARMEWARRHGNPGGSEATPSLVFPWGAVDGQRTQKNTSHRYGPSGEAQRRRGAHRYSSSRHYLHLGSGHGPGVFTHRRGQLFAHDPAQFQSTSAHDRAQHSAVTPIAYASRVPKTYEPKDLVGVAEIAERLGLGTSVVHDWRRRHTEFPQPVLQLKMGLIWSWTDVAIWARDTGRLDK